MLFKLRKEFRMMFKLIFLCYIVVSRIWKMLDVNERVDEKV